MFSVIGRDDGVVRLKFHSDGSRLVAEAISEASHRTVCALALPNMAAWLKREGYEWIEGSQARWMKDKPKGASTL